MVERSESRGAGGAFAMANAPSPREGPDRAMVERSESRGAGGAFAMANAPSPREGPGHRDRGIG
jgi:hypothetical protein